METVIGLAKLGAVVLGSSWAAERAPPPWDVPFWILFIVAVTIGPSML